MPDERETTGSTAARQPAGAPLDPGDSAAPADSPSPAAPTPHRNQLPNAGASGIPSGPPSAASASDTGVGLSAPTTKPRAQFEAAELAIVLSHYDLGIIEAVQPYPRGSRKAPKLILKTDRGYYLLKRRAKGKDDPYKVAFCHGIQIHLADRQFPLPHLIGTRRDNNSMLRWSGAIYELFEYIKGQGYDSSLEATTDAGKTLALFHKLLSDYQSDYSPAQGSYHASRTVGTSLEKIPETLLRVAPGEMQQHGKAIRDTVAFLQISYHQARDRVNALGLDDWPARIVHCDWHPGNMLFRGSRVVAVIDYDTARIQPRVLDVGNGALQFSILGGDQDPSQWPDYIDESRFKRFVRGYEAVPDMVLAKAEIACLPHLMTEALIAEMTIPIANTGHFGRLPGAAMLNMVERKVRWLQNRTDDLIEMIGS